MINTLAAFRDFKMVVAYSGRLLRKWSIPNLAVPYRATPFWLNRNKHVQSLPSAYADMTPTTPVDVLEVIPPSYRLSAQENESCKSLTETFRMMSPYINVHRGKNMVIHICGEAIESSNFSNIMQDIALLSSLGIKVVIVPGCRPQIDHRLFDKGMKPEYGAERRITDSDALQIAKDAAGFVRVQLESALCRGVVNAPGTGHQLSVTSGNFVVAQPVGVREGIDYQFTGDVRRINSERLHTLLDSGDVVIVSNIGYSPSGEVFNCLSEHVATRCAVEIGASKLVFLHEGEQVLDTRTGHIVSNMRLSTARDFLRKLKENESKSSKQFVQYLHEAVNACANGVKRMHLVSRHTDGAILMELFTRDGAGLLVSGDIYEGIRTARESDIPGIMRLIEPLQNQGMLVTRSQENIEANIGTFCVFERDGAVLACAALHLYENNCAEMACVAVDPTYRNSGKGNALLGYMLRRAHALDVQKLFVLTTRASHWFVERGFQQATTAELPPTKRNSIDFKRNSRVYIMHIQSPRAIDEAELLLHL